MIEIDRLLASALGDVDDEVVEEHVLSCSACAAVYESFVRIGPAIAALIRAGELGMVITKSLVEQLDREGLIHRRYELAPNEIVACTVSPTDVFALATYRADLATARRVDLLHGETRLADVPFDRDANRIYVLASSAYIRTLPSMQLHMRVEAIDAAGASTLTDYVLDHHAPHTG